MKMDLEARITTNNQWRNFKHISEVPEKVLREQFDWMEDLDANDNDRFLKYQGSWYHISEFETLGFFYSQHGVFSDSIWDGFIAHTYFSGVLIQVTDENYDEYKIGAYCM